ncbi:ATP-binding protein [Phreatobacter cathodiphilus]|nr:ATP-binding protein [Phreatobacter cathodiphilus]
MTSPLPHLSTILAEPDVARLLAEPGPWWLWTADASRLLVANTTGARAMGAGGLAAALDRDYSATHAFAAQIARLAPTLPADGTPRSERLRIAGRFGSESVVAEAFRLRAGEASLIAVRLPSMRQGSARDAALGLVATLRVPALAFDRAGRPLAASEEASAVAQTPLADLVGPAAGPLFDRLAAEGRATIDLVNGPMTVLALPEGEVLVAFLAPLARVLPETGLRLVAGGGAPAMPAAEAIPADEPAAVEPDAGGQASDEAPHRPEPAEAIATDLPSPLEPTPTETTLAAAAEPPTGETADVTTEAPAAASDDAAAETPPSDPAPVVVAHDAADDHLAPPQRFSWRMDADYRFHTIAPDEVAAPAGETFAAAVDRFGLDPQGTFTAAVTALRPFSGVPALWPLGGGRRRLAVTLAAFPTLRDGAFQGYAGFGLVVEEAEAAAPDAPLAEEAADEITDAPAEAAPEGELAPAVAEPAPETTESAPEAEAPAADAPSAVLLVAGPDEAASREADSTTEASETAAADDVAATAEPPAPRAEEPVADTAAAETAADEPQSDEAPLPAAPVLDAPAADPVSMDGSSAEKLTADDVATGEPHDADAVAEDPAIEPRDPATDRPVAGSEAADAPAAATGEVPPAAEPDATRPAAETRPVLTVHTNPPNVVALRTSVGQDIKRPQLSPGERNAFREIARALGARTDDAVPADPQGPRTPDPLPPPAEQSGSTPSMDEPVSEPAAEPTDLPQTASPATAGEAATTSFVDSGTPFGPLPSAFGTEATAGEPGRGADLAALLDKVPTGLIVHRGNAVLFANRTLLDWVGFVDAAALEEAGGVSRLFAGGTEDGGEAVTLTTAEGRDVPVEAHLSRVTWDGQSAFLFTLTRASVSDAAADQESATLSELRGRLEEVEQILDTATDGIVIVTSDGAIESMNRSAEALFGYESAEVKGLSVTTLFAPESHRSALDYCDGLLSNGVASVLNDGRQIIGRVKQGGLIPLYMTMGRTGPAARPKLAAVFRDMTNWKKAEEDLIAAKRQAEQASSQKSDFLAKISHEIRTPLNAIIGFSEVMMEERFGPVGNERYRDYLKDIHASGGHVLSLINDLLDLSKIEAGKLELAFTSVDLNDMVQSTVAIMQPQANRERVIIRSSLQPRLPNVVADSRSLRQIVLNLLSNSVKFTPAGGQIIVSTGLSDAGEAVLRVRDTGVGMTETELKAAMEPFRQVATSSPRAAKGTGLGLPLTKALVEANRASFGISSTPNQGTLVEVVFPPTRVLAE